MGRRKKTSEKAGYFYEKQEQAVLDYLNSEDIQERNHIYETILRPAFEKMTESIIRRYKLFIPNEEFEDTFNDTLSFLHVKLDKFKPGKFKAYSYYGTICKNYLIGRIETYNKHLIRNPSYDVSAEEYINNINYSESEENDRGVASETVEKLILKIKKMILSPKDYDLKDNEIKLGEAMVNLLENWEYVLTTDGSNKLNKNAILLFLRESTGLDTKGIRDNMKKFKKEFLIIKSAIIE